MRILLSALSCNSRHGSEALVGYKYAEALAAEHAVTIVAAPPYESPPRAKHFAASAGACNFNDVDAAALARFELRQLPKVWRLNRAQRFDVIHRVTPSAIQHSTLLPAIAAPLVVGPLLAADRPPDAFEPYLHRAPCSNGHAKAHLRRLFASLARRANGRLADCGYHLRSARRILAGTEIAVRHVPQEYREKCELITYSGVEHDVFTPPLDRNRDGLLRLLYVGRIVPYKGLELLLRAASEAARRCDLRLRVVGTGNPTYAAYCRELTAELGIEQMVEFVPSLAREQLPLMYREADVFCFPTLCDTYGVALLEAMSCGCAVLVSDVAGPREIVSDSTGVKVPMQTPEQYIHDYAEMIVTLAKNCSFREELGVRARQRIIEHHDWETIGRRLLEIYGRM